ncbi:MAG: hypothetical protein ABH811_00565 [archaeon]
MGKKREIIWIFLLLMIILIPGVLAGFSDWFKKVTGQASTEGPVDFNISVGTGNAPTITQVWNWSGAVTLNDGPSNTNLTINFSVTDADTASNLKDSSATINVSKSGVGRINNSACTKYESSGNFANYTCNVTMWWWDSDGVWTINISIQDTQGNKAINDTTNITINMVTGFVSGPGNLTFGTLEPGTTNQTPTNWITLNNTGNQDVGTHNVQFNATDLKGETTDTQGLWATNFSVGPTTGAAKPECDSGGSTSTNMTNGTSGDSFEPIYDSVLIAGNFSINNNVTGQETLYVCIQKLGLGLSQQSYSTLAEGAWTIKVV